MTTERLPDSIRRRLELHWPKQFTVAADEKKSETEREADKAVLSEGLRNFTRNVLRIMDRGVGVGQIETCLDQMSNEKGYRLFYRGTILNKLWALAPPSHRVPQPEVTEPEPVVRMCPNPATRALQQANGDPDRAVQLYPWLGEPQTFPSGHYNRRIDAPYWRTQLNTLNTPLPKIAGKVGFASGEDQW